VQHAAEGLSAPGIAAKAGLCGATSRFWLKRFNEHGLGGLEEDKRLRRPTTYTAEERSALHRRGAVPARRIWVAVCVVDAG
jgi:transposase